MPAVMARPRRARVPTARFSAMVYDKQALRVRSASENLLHNAFLMMPDGDDVFEDASSIFFQLYKVVERARAYTLSTSAHLIPLHPKNMLQLYKMLCANRRQMKVLKQHKTVPLTENASKRTNNLLQQMQRKQLLLKTILDAEIRTKYDSLDVSQLIGTEKLLVAKKLAHVHAITTIEQPDFLDMSSEQVNDAPPVWSHQSALEEIDKSGQQYIKFELKVVQTMIAEENVAEDNPDFCCPVSYMLMYDPVVTCNGFKYEKKR